MTTLTLCNKQLTTIDPETISAFTDLVELNIQDNFIESQEAIYLLSKIRQNQSNMTSLTSLNLSTNPIASATENVAVFVQNCTNLKSLALFEARIGDKGARALAGAIKDHPSLEYINVNSNGITLPAAMDMMLAAGSCANLQYLGFWGNPVSKESLEKVHTDMGLKFGLYL